MLRTSLIVLACVAAITALPTKPENEEESQPVSGDREPKFIFPVYNNGVKAPAGAVAGTRTLYTGGTNNAIVANLMRLFLPAGATLYSPTASTAANADGATPNLFVFSPLTGLTPVAAALKARQLDNPCGNGVECDRLLLQQLLQQQQRVLPQQQALRQQALPVSLASLPQGLSLIGTHPQDLQAFLATYGSDFSQSSQVQYPSPQFSQSPQVQYQSPQFYQAPQPQYPSFYSQQQPLNYLTPNVHFPIIINEGPAAPNSETPSPSLVLYDSPLSFLESMATPVEHQRKDLTEQHLHESSLSSHAAHPSPASAAGAHAEETHAHSSQQVSA